MTQPHKRRARAPQKHGGADNTAERTAARPSAKQGADNVAFASPKLPARGIDVAHDGHAPVTSPAITLREWLELDLGHQDELAHVRRLPPIYGLSLALAFSLLAWYAIAKTTFALLG
ncbi:MAG: hypothetical protein RL186_590 [Pseudomonadota bacterium]